MEPRRIRNSGKHPSLADSDICGDGRTAAGLLGQGYFAAADGGISSGNFLAAPDEPAPGSQQASLAAVGGRNPRPEFLNSGGGGPPHSRAQPGKGTAAKGGGAAGAGGSFFSFRLFPVLPVLRGFSCVRCLVLFSGTSDTSGTSCGFIL